MKPDNSSGKWTPMKPEQPFGKWTPEEAPFFEDREFGRAMDERVEALLLKIEGRHYTWEEAKQEGLTQERLEIPTHLYLDSAGEHTGYHSAEEWRWRGTPLFRFLWLAPWGGNTVMLAVDLV